MSNSSLGYSFIEGTDKIKEKLKTKKPQMIVKEEVNDINEQGDSDDDSGLANVDFSPPPKPESSGVERTKQREDALNRNDQHPAEPYSMMASEFAADYKEKDTVNEPQLNMPYGGTYSENHHMTSSSSHATSDLERKLNYMIHLLEDQKDERVEGITEEIVLYCFLGVFIIFVLDSFAKVGKYVR